MTFILNPAAPFVAGTGLFGFVLFALFDSAPDLTWYSAQHLTLEGALVVAIIVLWRAFQSKDVALTEMTKAVTEALTQTSASNTELRKIIEESVRAQEHLGSVIDVLETRLGNMHVNGGDKKTPHN